MATIRHQATAINLPKPAWLITYICAILVNTVLFLTMPITVFGEFYLFPRMVFNGLVPYRDFFDHHGFLVYYLLAPLSSLGSIWIYRAAFLLLVNLNLVLVMGIVKPLVNPALFGLLAEFVILAAFNYSENLLWYELFIAFFLLIAVYTSLRKKSMVWPVMGIFLSSLVKPTAGIFILAECYYRKSLRPLLWFGALWVSVLGVFSLAGFIDEFWDQVIRFNAFYQQYFTTVLGVNIRHNLTGNMLNTILLLYSSILLFTSFIGGSNRILIYLVMVLVGSVFMLYPKYDKANFMVFIYFIPVLTGYLIISAKGAKRAILTMSLYALIAATAIDTFLRYIPQRHRDSYKYPEADITRMQRLKKAIGTGRFYVMDNYPEYYYFLGQDPLTKTPLIYPWIRDYYPGLEDNLIHELSSGNIRFVIIPEKSENYHHQLYKLMDYITKNYKKFFRTETELVLEKI